MCACSSWPTNVYQNQCMPTNDRRISPLDSGLTPREHQLNAMSRLTSNDREAGWKWFVGAAREWKWAEGLKTFFHWTFLQDECGLSSQAIEVSGSDPAFCRKVWTNSGGRWVHTLMPQLAYLQGKGWLLHSFKTATSTQIAIHDFTLKFCNSFCKASYYPGGLTGDSSRINPTAAPFQTLTNRSTARLLNPNFT